VGVGVDFKKSDQQLITGKLFPLEADYSAWYPAFISLLKCYPVTNT
jgi:hypothetical protein